ncbi:hypothetical protein D3C71_1811740 [compost metagenome]
MLGDFRNGIGDPRNIAGLLHQLLQRLIHLADGIAGMLGDLPQCCNRIRAFAGILIRRFACGEHDIRIRRDLMNFTLQLLQQHRALLGLHRLLIRPNRNLLDGSENILIGMGSYGRGLLKRMRVI